MSIQKAGKTTKNAEISASERELWRPGRRTMTDVDGDLLKELNSQDLAFRWVNLKEYQRNGNVHRSGWRPYKPSKDGAFSGSDMHYGRSPEGYIQRGDMVLAYMPKWAFNEHSAEVQARTKRQSGVNKKQAAELREKLRREGMDSHVSEGYEDEQ